MSEKYTVEEHPMDMVAECRAWCPLLSWKQKGEERIPKCNVGQNTHDCKVLKIKVYAEAS